MGMLAEHADHVIGVDTHRDAHSAAAVATRTGAVVAQTTVAADAFGYKRLLRFARRHARGRRVWAIESSGSFGAGLTTFLLAHGEWVVEVDRPKRPARRNGAKSDELDAIRAAREALEREHLAQPRARGDREADPRAADHAPRRDPRPHEGDQPPQGTRRHRPRGTAPPVAQHAHRRARLPLLAAAHAAVALDRAPRDRDRAAPHRAPHPRARGRSQRPRDRDRASSSSRPFPSCSTRSASARSAPRSSTAPGHTAAGCATTAPSRCSAAPHRSPPPPARRSATGSTAPATASSTARCTRSSSPACSTTPPPAPTPPAALAEGKTPREIKRCLKRYVARHLFRLLEATGPHPVAPRRPPRTRTIGHCS